MGVVISEDNTEKYRAKLPHPKNISEHMQRHMRARSVEDVVRRAVRLLENKNWFKTFCRKLGQNLSLSS